MQTASAWISRERSMTVGRRFYFIWSKFYEFVKERWKWKYMWLQVPSFVLYCFMFHRLDRLQGISDKQRSFADRRCCLEQVHMMTGSSILSCMIQDEWEWILRYNSRRLLIRLSSCCTTTTWSNLTFPLYLFSTADPLHHFLHCCLSEYQASLVQNGPRWDVWCSISKRCLPRTWIRKYLQKHGRPIIQTRPKHRTRIWQAAFIKDVVVVIELQAPATKSKKPWQTSSMPSRYFSQHSTYLWIMSVY